MEAKNDDFDFKGIALSREYIIFGIQGGHMYMTRQMTNWFVFVFWHWRVALIHAFKRVQKLGMHRTGMLKTLQFEEFFGLPQR